MFTQNLKTSIHLRLSPQSSEFFEKKAKEFNMTVSDLIRAILQAYMSEEQKNENS